ncbi:unnamed protein product [Agarophyton chilense]
MTVQDLAENIYVILSAYLLAFLPWTVLDSSDFIGPEWKSIAATRRQGTIHLIIVMLPITYIIFYIVVQAATRDFKEMFASFVALIFSIIHLFKTVWGLLQINELHYWVANSIQNLQHMGVYYKPQGAVDMSKQHPLQVAEKMLINETLVDNQITHGDTQTYLKYGSLSLRISKADGSFLFQRGLFLFRFGIIAVRVLIDYLYYLWTGVKVHKLHQAPYNPIEVWLRWSSALIAQGFGHWVEEFRAPTQPEPQVPSATSQIHRHFMQRRDYFAGELLSSAGLHLCAEYGKGQNSLKGPKDIVAPIEKRSSLFLWEEWDWYSDVRDGRLTKNDLFLSAMTSGIGLPFSHPHFHALNKNPNRKTVADNGYGPQAFNLKKIIESLPVEFGEEVSHLDTAKLDWFAILLSLGARAKSHRKKFPTQWIPDTFDEVLKSTDPALENLRDQLGFSVYYLEDGSRQPRDAIHISRLCSFPIAARCLTLRSDTNRLVMKAGELIDVWMSLTAGEQFEFLLSVDKSWEQLCLSDSRIDVGNHDNVLHRMASSFNRARKISVRSRSLFDVQKDAEKARLMIQFAKTGHRYGHLEQTISFMGYTMESIRTYIARFLHHNPGTPSDVWEPRIEYSERNPLMSNKVVDVTDILREFIPEIAHGRFKSYFSRKGVQNRLIWKIQTVFQTSIGTEGSSPSSEILMVLCILSFPSLHVDVSISGEAEKNQKKTISLIRQKQDPSSISFVKINIRPSCAPQKLFVCIHCDMGQEDDFRAFALLGREENKSDYSFLWECWRDSFTARLQAMAEWQKDHKFPHTEVVRSTHSISTNPDRITTGSIGTGDEVSRWVGWLPFRFEFCRHEVEHPEFLKQYPRRSNLEVSFTSRLDHQQSTARFPGFELLSFRYEDSDPEYLMYACSVIQDYLTSDTQGPIETNIHLGEEVRRMLDKPREYFEAGARKLHRAVILLEIAAVELGNPAALRACVMHLIEHHHIASDVSRAVGLIERCVAKFYIAQQPDRRPNIDFDIKKEDIAAMYDYLMSKHGYEAQVFWSYFKFLDLMSSGDLNSSSLQSTMRRTFMHTKDYDIVFELGQFPPGNMSNIAGTRGVFEHLTTQDIEFAFYDRAITEGHSASSMFELGRMYEKGERGLQVDEARAAALYHMAIENGHTSGAKKALGDLYRRGAPQLVERKGDLNYAVKMYWRAVSEDNDGEAMYELGNLYHFGAGLSKDPLRAAALYQGAIMHVNDFRAMRGLASMYRQGDGVSRNPVLSVTLYQLAIDIGDDNDSRAQLALLLLSGDEDVEPDEPRARSLHRHLKQQGMMIPESSFSD